MEIKKEAAPVAGAEGQQVIEESYRELLERMKTVKPGKDCRELHKKLKKYGDGMFFMDRYPNFTLWLSVVALVLAILVFILRVVGIVN